ncbi:unnamed protein product [Caenorhabditis bovis]|uniref:Uncharacterized protein n=1 Tax=Caenorhabditis bovis TaxID=2654633 RepID=A0A8S1EXC1_9PELO|nr:unnamed protein product [Caenorhabditis bovis]
MRDEDPIWITRIQNRVSFKRFYERINLYKELGIDYSRLKKYINSSVAPKDVFQVMVETWNGNERCILVDEWHVKATGPVYERFLTKYEDLDSMNKTMEADDTFSAAATFEWSPEDSPEFIENSDDDEGSTLQLENDSPCSIEISEDDDVVIN